MKAATLVTVRRTDVVIKTLVLLYKTTLSGILDLIKRIRESQIGRNKEFLCRSTLAMYSGSHLLNLMLQVVKGHYIGPRLQCILDLIY